jgi:hypothetical protein
MCIVKKKEWGMKYAFYDEIMRFFMVFYGFSVVLVCFLVFLVVFGGFWRIPGVHIAQFAPQFVFSAHFWRFLAENWGFLGGKIGFGGDFGRKMSDFGRFLSENRWDIHSFFFQN